MSDVFAPRAVVFVVKTQPIPKARPRVGQHHTYTPPKTRAYESEIAWEARATMGPRPPLSGPLAVELHFFRDGNRRCDLDNLIKSALDGMNGVVYKDDQQVEHITARVTYGAEHARAEITVRAV